MRRRGRGNREKSVRASDASGAYVDLRRYYPVRLKLVYKHADAGYVGYRVHRAHLVEVYLLDAPPVRPALRLGYQVIHRYNVGLDLVGYSKPVYDSAYLAHSRVAVSAVFAVVIMTMVVVMFVVMRMFMPAVMLLAVLVSMFVIVTVVMRMLMLMFMLVTVVVIVFMAVVMVVAAAVFVAMAMFVHMFVFLDAAYEHVHARSLYAAF